MQRVHHQWASGRAAWVGLVIVFALLLAGCNSYQQPVYQGKQGFRFTPPPGWAERARDDALPVKPGRKQPDLPLPPLGVPGGSVQERFLVLYHCLSAGKGWLRVTVADLSSSVSLKECVSVRSPVSTWKRESEVDSLQVSGLPAARVAFVGRWNDQDYISETVAVRQGEQVYIITASFPASDGTAREEVRKAVAGAIWPQ